MSTTTMTNERTNAELIQAIRDEDKGLGEHAMLSARIIHNATVTMQVAWLEWKKCNRADEAMVHIEGLLEDSDNIPAEGYAGCGDISNTDNPMIYFRNNHLNGDLSTYQSRMAPLIDELERRMVCLQKRMDLMTAERDHWKANHDNRVNAAKILMDRTDMPLERVGAYKHYVAALEENQKLRERAETAEAELLAVREDNHSMILEIHSLRIERDALAAELAKLRDREAKQKPVAMVDAGDDGYFAEILPDCSVGVGDQLYAFPPLQTDPALWEASFDQWWDAHGQYLRAGGGQYEKTFGYHAWKVAAALYAAPIPALAVPDWNVNKASA